MTSRHVTMSPVMRFDIVLIRLVFTGVLLVAGYVLHPIPGHRLVSTAAGGVIAVAIIFFEMRIRRSSLKTLIGAAAGSILGIIGAYLIGSLISSQESMAVAPETKTFLTLALTFFMAYVGLMVGAAKGDYLELSALGGIFTDKASGAKHQRPGLDTCLDQLQAGEFLLVWRLDRLGRSMRHLVTLIDQLRDRNIGFRSVCDGAIDTTTP